MRISTLKKLLYSFITIILLIIIWELYSTYRNEPSIFPHTTQIIKSFFKLFNLDNLKTLGITLLRITISVLVAFIVSLIVGLLYIWKKDTIYFFKPIISMMKTIPLAIISIFLWLIFNGNIAPYIITTLIIIPLSIEGVITSIDGIDKVLIEDLKMINTNMFKSLIYVYIPLIKNYLLMVFLQIFGLGLKVMVMGEYICQTKNSVGKILSVVKSGVGYEDAMSELVAWGILLVLIVVIIEILIKLIVKKIQNQNKKTN